jgi:hypothetical protein
LHNASLCYLAWGVSFVARVFDSALGAALWLLVLHQKEIDPSKTKDNVPQVRWHKNRDTKKRGRVGRVLEWRGSFLTLAYRKKWVAPS